MKNLEVEKIAQDAGAKFAEELARIEKEVRKQHSELQIENVNYFFLQLGKTTSAARELSREHEPTQLN